MRVNACTNSARNQDCERTLPIWCTSHEQGRGCCAKGRLCHIGGERPSCGAITMHPCFCHFIVKWKVTGVDSQPFVIEVRGLFTFWTGDLCYKTSAISIIRSSTYERRAWAGVKIKVNIFDIFNIFLDIFDIFVDIFEPYNQGAEIVLFA